MGRQTSVHKQSPPRSGKRNPLLGDEKLPTTSLPMIVDHTKLLKPKKPSTGDPVDRECSETKAQISEKRSSLSGEKLLKPCHPKSEVQVDQAPLKFNDLSTADIDHTPMIECDGRPYCDAQAKSQVGDCVKTINPTPPYEMKVEEAM